MKKLLLLAMILLLFSLTCAAAESHEPSLYVINENYAIDYYINQEGFVEMSILRCTVDLDQRTKDMMDEELHIVIPAELDGYPVASIDNFFAFQATRGILPARVVSITIPESVTLIMDNAFLFRDLTQIVVSPDNPVYESVDGVLFNKLEQSLLCYPAARADECYTVPDGTVSLVSYAFAFCQNLKSLTIPDSITTMHTNTFDHSCSLEVLNLGSGFSWLRPGRVVPPFFADFSFLQDINVSEQHPAYSSVDGVLYSADRTTLLFYPCGRTDERFDLPADVTAIDPYAFENYRNPLAVSLPESILFEDGEPQAIYPLALTDERMQQFLNAPGLSSSTQRRLKDSYQLIEPGTKKATALEEAIPALKDAPLWVERRMTAKGTELSESNQARLAGYFAEAGYTLDDLAIDDANLAAPRSLYPCKVVCHQLTPALLPAGCALIVEPDSLAHHWALQNGVSVIVAD